MQCPELERFRPPARDAGRDPHAARADRRRAVRARDGERRHGARPPHPARHLVGARPLGLPALRARAVGPGHRAGAVVGHGAWALPILRGACGVALSRYGAGVRGVGGAARPQGGAHLGGAAARAVGLPDDRAVLDRPGLPAPPRRADVPRHAHRPGRRAHAPARRASRAVGRGARQRAPVDPRLRVLEAAWHRGHGGRRREARGDVRGRARLAAHAAHAVPGGAGRHAVGGVAHGAQAGPRPDADPVRHAARAGGTRLVPVGDVWFSAYLRMWTGHG